MNRGRGLVPLGVVLFCVLAAFGVQLQGAQRDSRRAAGAQFCPYASVALLDMLTEQHTRAHAAAR